MIYWDFIVRGNEPVLIQEIHLQKRSGKLMKAFRMKSDTNVSPKTTPQPSSQKTAWRNVAGRMERLVNYMMDHCKTPVDVPEKVKCEMSSRGIFDGF